MKQAGTNKNRICFKSQSFGKSLKRNNIFVDFESEKKCENEAQTPEITCKIKMLNTNNKFLLSFLKLGLFSDLLIAVIHSLHMARIIFLKSYIFRSGDGSTLSMFSF